MQDLSLGSLIILILQRDQNCLHYLPQMVFSNGFSQPINEPRHMETNSTSSFDQFFFSDKPGILVESGVHSSLHPNCCHHIINSTFILNICYPHHINKLAWGFKKADANNIRKALGLVNWERLFDQKCIEA